jgi:hypothetical protein
MATERAEFNFTVKESADGTPSIAAEPMEGTMRSVGPSRFRLMLV